MKIQLTTWPGNTVYSIHTEKYGEEHHLGYVDAKGINEILKRYDLQKLYDEIKEPCPEQKRLNECIGAMIKQDRTYFTDDRGNHRDGLD
tara:strand:- start:1142 stop:1408 length:267 start_codon:yes stop_codon:yes gene_type:complete